MRCTYCVVFICILLCAACLTTGCVSDTPAPDEKPVKPALTPVPVPEVPDTGTGYIRFEDAVDAIGLAFDWDPTTNPDLVQGFTRSGEAITIHFLSGMNLDNAGDARIWAFGTSTANGTQVRAYDGRQWTIVPFGEPFVSVEIDPDHIIPPRRLFEMNRDLIFDKSIPSTGLREIELTDGRYTLAFHNSTRTLLFDAVTGDPLVPEA